MTSNITEPLHGVSHSAWQLGWLLRELGIGIVSSRCASSGETTFKLTPYNSHVPLHAITEELAYQLSAGWQSADEYPVIDAAPDAQA